jgi:hypothetical protein
VAEEAVMPALFAYLIALGLLFGAGYGALNWLAEPEPVKVSARVKSKTKLQPTYGTHSPEIPEATPQAGKPAEAKSSETKSSAYDAAPSPRDQQMPSHAEPSAAADNRATQPEPAAPQPAATPGKEIPTPAKEIRSANAAISSEEAKPKVDEVKPRAEQTARPAVRADPPKNVQSDASSASAPAPIDRSSRRTHARQASNHVERRKLAVMTLRTIEFPDGRRITQLIPYGGGER